MKRISTICSLWILVFTAKVYGSQCIPPLAMTTSFCNIPPVVPVSTSAYIGKWFQIYVNKEALQVSPFKCATANYTLQPDKSIGVKNCFFSPTFLPGVRCLFGKATERPNAQSTSRLQVQFNPSVPPGPYNVAALLGKPQNGYYAAAVYSCVSFGGARVEQWYMLARDPKRAENILTELISRLRCTGYSVSRNELIKTTHDCTCQYFDKNGFSEVDFFSLPQRPTST